MRIAYVVLHLDEIILQGGVGKKIKRQTTVWRNNHHDVRTFVLSPDKFKFDGTNTYPFASQYAQNSKFSVSNEISRIRTLQGMLRDLETFHPDIIYLRYGLYTLFLEKIHHLAPVVVEINTNDIDEYRYRGFLYYWLNKLFRGKLLKKAAGIVVPSYELRDLPANKKYKKPMEVVTNGIDLSEISTLAPPTNKIPVLAFVATPGYPWHGIDKIVRLAKQEADIKFIVIGYDISDFSEPLPTNINVLGFLNKPEIIDALSKADAAFGTLALHRKNMNEACPLKTREALAYGLPLIYAYKDPDLDDVNSELILRLPNTENNLIEHVDEIREFAYKVIGKRINREIIAAHIDQKLKEKQRLEFLKMIMKLPDYQL